MIDARSKKHQITSQICCELFSANAQNVLHDHGLPHVFDCRGAVNSSWTGIFR